MALLYAPPRNVYEVKIEAAYQSPKENTGAAIAEASLSVMQRSKTLTVLANSIPQAIEVAEQYLAKGHDPITSVTLLCEDVKQL